MVCIVSGGNIDAARLSAILAGRVPTEDDLADGPAQARCRGAGVCDAGSAGTSSEVEETISRLSCVQIDSITAVERSHRIVLGSRVGDYPRQTVSRLLGEGRVFEFWAHQACLIPVEDWPLYRR